MTKKELFSNQGLKIKSFFQMYLLLGSDLKFLKSDKYEINRVDAYSALNFYRLVY